MSGCGRISQEDATDNPELWGGYAHQIVYRLKRDVFLLKLDDDWKGRRYALSPEGRFKHPDRFYSVPESIEQYQRTQRKLSQDEIVTGRAYQIPTTVIGVVKAGTHIRCTKLLRYYQWTWFFGEARGTMVFAEIMDGRYVGTVVDILDLSTRKTISFRNKPITVYRPIPQLLTSKKMGLRELVWVIFDHFQRTGNMHVSILSRRYSSSRNPYARGNTNGVRS